MSEQAFKMVDADLTSPFAGQSYAGKYGCGPHYQAKLTYTPGAVLHAAPEPGTSITARKNRIKAINAFTTLDDALEWAHTWELRDYDRDFRFVELSYEEEDLLKTTGPPCGATVGDESAHMEGPVLHLKKVTVVAEVFAP